MKFRVICREVVATEFFVEAPSGERLEAWLEDHGADAVSKLTERQTVHDRSYKTEPWPTPSPLHAGDDYNTEEEVKWDTR